MRKRFLEANQKSAMSQTLSRGVSSSQIQRMTVRFAQSHPANITTVAAPNLLMVDPTSGR
ncbi:hypothetical protein CCH79_00018662 [Gambusia affinis]|uniref:Uncharacterized protein n=1 Tax=Gambusia affinis TaxID=33528 RepID=A0A315V9P5_GAMAF|nr:hypothetical protein CCH79_00018662 [Gambusia affinis]